MSTLDPIFILGICPRSGTNYLYNLLLRHPQCIPSHRGGQDSLLYGIHHIQKYIEHTGRYWKSHWGQSETDLAELIGGGMLQYLCPEVLAPEVTHYVTKTPHTYNIDKFYHFFPAAKLIIILRNGPDAVESGMRSFNWNLDDSIKMYANSAARIIRFREKNKGNRNLHITKYEDIVNGKSKAFQELLNFCGLNLEKFDFKLIDAMPVYGSSSTRDTVGSVHWEPETKEDSFKPIERSNEWSKWKHWRFNYVSGKNSVDLHYSLKFVSTSLFYRLYNLFRDFNYFFYRIIRRVRNLMKL